MHCYATFDLYMVNTYTLSLNIWETAAANIKSDFSTIGVQDSSVYECRIIIIFKDFEFAKSKR